MCIKANQRLHSMIPSPRPKYYTRKIRHRNTSLPSCTQKRPLLCLHTPLTSLRQPKKYFTTTKIMGRTLLIQLMLPYPISFSVAIATFIEIYDTHPTRFPLSTKNWCQDFKWLLQPSQPLMPNGALALSLRLVICIDSENTYLVQQRQLSDDKCERHNRVQHQRSARVSRALGGVGSHNIP